MLSKEDQKWIKTETGRQLAASATSWLLTLEKECNEEGIPLEPDFSRELFCNSDWGKTMESLRYFYDNIEAQNEDSILLVTGTELLHIDRLLKLANDVDIKEGFRCYFTI